MKKQKQQFKFTKYFFIIYSNTNNIIGHCLGSFYVSEVSLGSRRSMESGGNVGDTAEVAETSKKRKLKKETYLSPNDVK